MKLMNQARRFWARPVVKGLFIGWLIFGALFAGWLVTRQGPSGYPSEGYYPGDPGGLDNHP